jgi:methyl-accepting chemotaxis protein
MQLRTKVNIAVMAVFAVTITTLVWVAFLSSQKIMTTMLSGSQIALASDNAANVGAWIQGKLAAVQAGARDLARYPDQPKPYISSTIKTMAEAGGFSKVHPGYESGLIVYSDDWQPPADYDPRKRPWYQQAKKEMTTGLTQPYIAASTGKLILTFMSPMLHDGNLIGVYGCDVTLDYIVKQVLSVKLGKSGYAFVVDKEGKILVHPDSSYPLKKSLRDLSGDLTGVAARFAAAPSGQIDYRLDGSEKVMSFARIPSTGWYLCVTVDRSEIFAPVTRQLRVLALVGAGFLTAGLLIIVIFLKGLLSPLGRLYQHVANIADGEGDLTRRIDVGNRRDEIGLLAEKLNRFIENMRGIILQIADASRTLSAESTRLTATAGGISVGAEEVAAQTVTVATASEEMAATAADIARSCHQAAGSAEHAAGTTQAGFQVVSRTIDGIRRRGESTLENAGAISSLGERSEQIGAIVATIEDIADQTNLLALNAAIEAARAGEQGRGFAVVADEVRALAERTTKATKEISDMIRIMQQETRGAIAAMEHGVKGTEQGAEEAAGLESALRNILEQVNAVTGQVNQIAVAAEEQTATTSEITSNIQQMAEVVNETARGSQLTAESAAQLSNLAGNLQRIVGKFTL